MPSSKRSRLKRVFFLPVLILLPISSALAQESTKPFTVGVRLLDGPCTDQLAKTVQRCLENHLKERAALSENPMFEVLVAVKPVRREKEQEVILSVITSSTLPPEVVELGKKHEIFYAIFGTKSKWGKLPENGKFIREYVTEEYLKQFRDIYRNDIYVFPVSEISMQCKKIVNDFFTRFYRKRI